MFRLINSLPTQARVGQIVTVKRRKRLVFLSLIDCRINGCNWTHTYDTRTNLYTYTIYFYVYFIYFNILKYSILDCNWTHTYDSHCRSAVCNLLIGGASNGSQGAKNSQGPRFTTQILLPVILPFIYCRKNCTNHMLWNENVMVVNRRNQQNHIWLSHSHTMTLPLKIINA